VYDIIKGVPGWEAVLNSNDAIKETFGLIAEGLRRWNGTRYLAYRKGAVIGGDASAVGIGGGLHSITGEPSTMMKVMFSFSPEEAAAAQTNKYSSNLREVRTCWAILSVGIEQRHHQLVHRLVIYVTDSTGARDSINRGRSPTCPETTKWIHKIRTLCLENDIQLEVVWRPRETIQLWDDHSKEEDASEWILESRVLKEATAQLLTNEEFDDFCLDGMAGPPPYTQHWRFVSRYLTPGCWGQNLYACGMRIQALQLELRRQPILVNGPFGDIANQAAFLRDYQIDAIVVSPDWPAPWRGVLDEMPRGAPDVYITRRNIYTPSLRVPARDRARAKGASYNTRISYIKWSAASCASAGSGPRIPGPPPV
jgi:hypothetical protein